MSQVIAVLALIALQFTLGFLVMTQAWGLQVQSWGWLVGGLLGQVVVGITLNVIKAEK